MHICLYLFGLKYDLLPNCYIAMCKLCYSYKKGVWKENSGKKENPEYLLAVLQALMWTIIHLYGCAGLVW